jgi:hypothetical protein
MTVRRLGHAELHVSVSGSEDTISRAAQPAAFPEASEFVRVRDTQLDVEKTIERHHAPAGW